MSRDRSPDPKRGRVASSRERASSEHVRMEPTCLIDEVVVLPDDAAAKIMCQRQTRSIPLSARRV